MFFLIHKLNAIESILIESNPIESNAIRKIQKWIIINFVEN